MNYGSNITEHSIPAGDLSALNKAGSLLATGGQLKFEGMAKYKDKYYFEVSILQSIHAGLGADRPSITNRVGHYELGYNVNSKLSINASAQNNELLFSNKDRHAIDVKISWEWVLSIISLRKRKLSKSLNISGHLILLSLLISWRAI